MMSDRPPTARRQGTRPAMRAIHCCNSPTARAPTAIAAPTSNDTARSSSVSSTVTASTISGPRIGTPGWRTQRSNDAAEQGAEPRQRERCDAQRRRQVGRGDGRQQVGPRLRQPFEEVDERARRREDADDDRADDHERNHGGGEALADEQPEPATALDDRRRADGSDRGRDEERPVGGEAVEPERARHRQHGDEPERGPAQCLARSRWDRRSRPVRRQPGYATLTTPSASTPCGNRSRSAACRTLAPGSAATRWSGTTAPSTTITITRTRLRR